MSDLRRNWKIGLGLGLFHETGVIGKDTVLPFVFFYLFFIFLNYKIRVKFLNTWQSLNEHGSVFKSRNKVVGFAGFLFSEMYS